MLEIIYFFESQMPFKLERTIYLLAMGYFRQGECIISSTVYYTYSVEII